ncbi:pilus assembly protein [Massilia sp. Dwa41.01b]|nr:pilus assembly protein [Massilia sp. Dwa41.01b]
MAAAKSASAERDRLVAHALADAALVDAERDIDGGAGAGTARAAIFATGDAGAFLERCAGSAERQGLCQAVPAPGIPAWQLADLTGEAGVDYGRFSGRVLPEGGPLPARLPRYLIELLPAPSGGALYRITAIGFGTGEATVVVLQVYYRRALAGAAPGAPGIRLGWREIANWPELHRAAS